MIRFHSVTKIYAKGEVALQDVSFRVSKGEFLFLTGHSGAGKSTILKLLHAEQRPTHGEVRVSGFLVSSLGRSEIPRLRRRVGVVFLPVGIMVAVVFPVLADQAEVVLVEQVLLEQMVQMVLVEGAEVLLTMEFLPVM